MKWSMGYDEKFQRLARRAQARFDALCPEDQAAHREAQKQSFIRGMGPCEHGERDFETCPQCRAR